MIHVNEDKDTLKSVDQMIQDYTDGDTEMHLPHKVMQLDKPVLLYIISRLLAK